MACSASCGGNWSSHAFHRIKMAPSPFKLCVSSSVFCSKSNHDALISRRNKASSTSDSSGKPNRGDFSARASDRSCCGDTSTSSSATTSSTSQQAISSVFSPICAGMPKARNSSCKGSSPARLRDNTMISCGGRPAATCPAIQRAAWRASSVRTVSSTVSRGVVRLSRQTASSTLASRGVFPGALAVLDIGGNLPTKPTSVELVVCSRNPS